MNKAHFILNVYLIIIYAQKCLASMKLFSVLKMHTLNYGTARYILMISMYIGKLKPNNQNWNISGMSRKLNKQKSNVCHLKTMSIIDFK